jgi:glycine/D-amino acid oxidase-like deaminating enzyme
MSRTHARDGGHTLLAERTPATTRSLWLAQSDILATPQAGLCGDARCDVAIVGGGYVGLWTALELKQREPALAVTIVEQDVCGGGASGRNGGQVHTWSDRVATLAMLCGAEEALRLVRASEDALDELEALQDMGEDIGLRRDGWLQTATTRAQLGAWGGMLDACAALGLAPYERLGAEEVRARTGSAVHLAGVLEPRAGTVHPARLVATLRRRALAAGVVIHEGTPVTRIGREDGLHLVTPQGRIFAERVVLATGCWGSALSAMRRRIFVVASDVVVTPQIPQRLAAIGWTHGTALCDSQSRVLYYQATADGRVVFGRGGGRIAYAGRVGRRMDQSPDGARDAATAFRRVYPDLADVPVQSSWSGPVDRTLAGVPLFGRLDGHGDVHYGLGWSGTGVAQSRIGGRILASLTLGADDEWARCGLVDQPVHRYPPEPLRFLGAHLVREAVARVGAADDAGRRAGRMAGAVARLVPTLEVEAGE